MRIFLFAFLLLILHCICLYPQAWERIVAYEATGLIYEIEVDSSGNIYCTFANRLMYSSDNGGSWERLLKSTNSDSYMTDILLINSKEIYVSCYGGIYYTPDAGITWCKLNGSGSFFLGNDYENNIYAGDPIRKSSDKGRTWEVLDPNLHLWSFYYTYAGALLAGSTCGVLLSQDKGTSWTRTGSFNCGDVHRIRGYNNDSLIFVVGSDRLRGIYYSSDGGYNWHQAANSDTIYHAWDILTLDLNHIYYASTVQGLFLYDHINDSIKRINFELFQEVTALAMDSLGFLYVASRSGLYRSKYTLDSAKYIRNKKDSVIVTVPTDYSLQQNYPNPFNAGTKIEYSLEKSGHVTLEVYNALGECVSQLVNSYKDKGEYSVNFNPKDLPSGIYFYKLKSGDFVQIKKMILLR